MKDKADIEVQHQTPERANGYALKGRERGVGYGSRNCDRRPSSLLVRRGEITLVGGRTVPANPPPQDNGAPPEAERRGGLPSDSVKTITRRTPPRSPAR